MKLAGLALTAILLCSTKASFAQEYRFSGTINDVRDFNNTGVASIIPLGTAFSGSFFYDPSAAVVESNVNGGRSLLVPPVGAVTTSISGLTFESTDNQLQIGSGSPGIFFLSSTMTSFSGLPDSLTGFAVVTRIQLYGNISASQLPATLSLSDLPGFIAITGYSTTASSPSYFSYNVGGNLSSLAPIPSVPEPATWLMIIGGFGVVGGMMRYRRRSTKIVYV